MNIHTIYRHPADLEAEAMLSREQPYPDSFTLAERTAERMTRARNGLAHVMTDLLPLLEKPLCFIRPCWIRSAASLPRSDVKRWQSYTITSLLIWMKTAGLKCQRRTEGATQCVISTLSAK